MRDQPDANKAKFFVMIGHSFGLVSLVYNYNGRSSAIDEMLEKLLAGGLQLLMTTRTGSSRRTRSSRRSRLLSGTTFCWVRSSTRKSPSNNEAGDPRCYLHLDGARLGNQRRKESGAERSDRLDTEGGEINPGTAGKFKGKLMFGASQEEARRSRSTETDHIPSGEEIVCGDLHGW